MNSSSPALIPSDDSIAQGEDGHTFSARIEPEGHVFDVPPDMPVLLAAEFAGLNWASSCRNGTCRTCIRQLTEGSVSYRIEWPGLSAEEKLQGCILPCVAYAKSDLVIRALT